MAEANRWRNSYLGIPLLYACRTVRLLGVTFLVDTLVSSDGGGRGRRRLTSLRLRHWGSIGREISVEERTVGAHYSPACMLDSFVALTQSLCLLQSWRQLLAFVVLRVKKRECDAGRR